MQPSRDHERFLLEMCQRIQPEKKGREHLRESLDTMMLGSLSISIGIVVLIAMLSGIRGRRVGQWNEEYSTLDSRKAIRTFVVPSDICGFAAIVGEGLGAAGIILAWKRRRAISAISIIGTALCLFQMYLFFGYLYLIHLVF